jgi:imidazolonepropionase
VSEALKLWRNARLATCDESLRVIERRAMLTQGERLTWIGEESSIPDYARSRDKRGLEVYDLRGAWVSPGLIDCHTHLVFAGNRAEEYAQRLQGTSYEDIARRGGCIRSTMPAVRQASDTQLFHESAPRLKALLAEGITTIEIKSGYGLTLRDEAKKMLPVARAGPGSPVA